VSAINELGAPEALPVAVRAQQALQQVTTKELLVDLVAKTTDIIAISDKAGREMVHRAMMVLKGTRVSIEKAGKAARDDATKFSKAVIAEEAALVAILDPEETRLQKLRDDFDAAEELERQRRLEAERARQRQIQERIDVIVNTPASVMLQDVPAMERALALLSALDLGESAGTASFGERLGDARLAHSSAVHRLTGMIAAKRDAIAEEARRREEMAAEEARLAAERARLKAEEEAIRQAADAERERLNRRREIEAQHAARERAAAAAEAERLRLEAARIETERAVQQAEFDRQRREFEAAKEAFRKAQEALNSPPVAVYRQPDPEVATTGECRATGLLETLSEAVEDGPVAEVRDCVTPTQAEPEMVSPPRYEMFRADVAGLYGVDESIVDLWVSCFAKDLP
jgi:hypothetical protein